jgi:hypothetical protein
MKGKTIKRKKELHLLEHLEVLDKLDMEIVLLWSDTIMAETNQQFITSRKIKMWGSIMADATTGEKIVCVKQVPSCSNRFFITVIINTVRHTTSYIYSAHYTILLQGCANILHVLAQPSHHQVHV